MTLSENIYNLVHTVDNYFIAIRALNAHGSEATQPISPPGGVLGYKRDRGGGGRRIFLGLKFSTPVFFWVEDLTVYFFGSEKSARIFLGSNFRQANSSYAIQAKVLARSESMNRIISSLVFFLGAQYKVHVFFWVQNIRLRRTPRHVYTRVPPWDFAPPKGGL